MLVKHEPISIKIGTHVKEETLNKTVQKSRPLHLHYVLALTGKFEVTDLAFDTVLNVYIVMNH